MVDELGQQSLEFLAIGSVSEVGQGRTTGRFRLGIGEETTVGFHKGTVPHLLIRQS